MTDVMRQDGFKALVVDVALCDSPRLDAELKQSILFHIAVTVVFKYPLCLFMLLLDAKILLFVHQPEMYVANIKDEARENQHDEIDSGPQSLANHIFFRGDAVP